MYPKPEATATTRYPLDMWQFRRLHSAQPALRDRLPHDAMLAEGRSPTSQGGAAIAWFSGGAYEYSTEWQANSADSGKEVALRFEGVQGDATVLVNSVKVGELRGGYTEFELPIHAQVRWGAANHICVLVDHTAQPTSRWYPGSGLYRPVHVVVRPRTHFACDGIRFRTRHIDARAAAVDVAYSLVNPESTCSIIAELFAGQTAVATASSGDPDGLLSFSVPQPRPWSADDPYLHELVVRAERAGAVLDIWRERVGLRTIAVDAQHGLRVNGETVLLRGAAIHHDNGILGAATHRAAEYRRIRLLKEAGFNAIRSAHNPMSRHLLDACDELGMYVLDELADYWFGRKSAYDHADRFRATWREDADRLIEKDRNRPSVIMYGIGNEIPETATPEGVALAQEITTYFHLHDPDRPVTVAVNPFLNTLVSLNASPYRTTPGNGNEQSIAGSTEANAMVNHIGKMMHLVSQLPRADKVSRDVFAVVDIAGYNYGLARYRHDVRAYPARVILGTETLPGDVAWAWNLVQRYPAVIGDFVWTGWEYLGEAGVAVWVPGKKAGLAKPYPCLIAGPGMVDLIGKPDVSLRLAHAAWGHLDQPVIAVRPLDRSGVPYVRSAWRVTDAVESWSWRGMEGRMAEIEVYALEDEVELFLNGRSLGRRAAGKRRTFVTRCKTPYERGTLVAVGYRNGEPVSRTVLRSAAEELTLSLSAEREMIAADGADLAFVMVTIADADGEAEMLADDQVELTVSGPAELIGFGSAAPASEESFLTNRHSTYRGRALAILRSTGEPGAIRCLATSTASGSAELHLRAIAPEVGEPSAAHRASPTQVEVMPLPSHPTQGGNKA
jgi:hypothetical protein